MIREQSEYLRWSASAPEQRFAFTPANVIPVETFEELKEYTQRQYQIGLSEVFLKQDFEIARIICTGVDSVLRDFPNAQQYIREIAYGGKSSFLGTYEEYADATQSRIIMFRKSFYSCKGQAYSTAVHEVAHAVDISLGRVADEVVNTALRETAGHLNGKKAEQQLLELLGTKHWKDSVDKREIFAFSFELCYINNKTKLAETVFSRAKGML